MHSLLLLTLTSGSNQRTVKSRTPSSGPDGLILLRTLHTPAMLRIILTKRMYVYSGRRGIYSDVVSRLRAVAVSSMR